MLPVELTWVSCYLLINTSLLEAKFKPEALKSLYRSSGYKKNQLVLCKYYILQW
jgi:hypothetical protein